LAPLGLSAHASPPATKVTVSDAVGCPGEQGGNATPDASVATPGDGIELTLGLETPGVAVAGALAVVVAVAVALAPVLAVVEAIEGANGLADGVELHPISAITATAQIAADFRTGQPPELHEQRADPPRRPEYVPRPTPWSSRTATTRDGDYARETVTYSWGAR
jgi:hypothetical protein